MAFELKSLVKDLVARSTVGFVDAGVAPPAPLGSGTFVRFGNIFGILTCAHVLRILPRQPGRTRIAAFPVRDSARQSLAVEVNDDKVLAIGGDKEDDIGPDLGFLFLSPDEAGLLAAQVSVVDGDQHRDHFGEPQPDTTDPDIAGVSVLGGVVGEWSVEEAGPTGRSQRRLVGLGSFGEIELQRQEGEHDLLTFRPRDQDDFSTPRSYGGTSGGGLWRLYLDRATETTYTLKRRDLVGVAFFETKDRRVICHGPGSIYEVLRAKIVG
jgi:hypothetical protein